MAFKIAPGAAAAAAYSSAAAIVGGGSAAGAAAAAAAADSRGVSFFPTIGLHAKHEEVSVNFGAAPWTFDIEAYTLHPYHQHCFLVLNSRLCCSYEEDVMAEFEAAVCASALPPLPVINMVRHHGA